VLVEAVRERLDDPIDGDDGDALSGEFEQLDDVTHQLLVAPFPEGIVAVTDFLFSDGHEGGKEVDDAFGVPGAATRTKGEFVVQGIEAMA
jgi:hypothetical protein